MNCPQYANCRLVLTRDIVNSESLRQTYIDSFCTRDPESWECCKRYQTRQQLQFCPDFVLPDTELTIDEIVDCFDDSSS